MLYTLFRYIPKKCFSYIIIPKTQHTCCDLVYVESKEQIHFGNFSKSNIERSYDNYLDYFTMIEIRNTITTKYNKTTPLIYEKINISIDAKKKYDIHMNYFLSIYNLDNNKVLYNLELSNHKIQDNNLDLERYLNNDTYELYKFIEKEIKN